MTHFYCFPLLMMQKFKEYLSSKHPNMNFLLEKGNDGRLPFLNIIVFVRKGNFPTVFAGKRPSVVFILTSAAASYLKSKKLI